MGNSAGQQGKAPDAGADDSVSDPYLNALEGLAEKPKLEPLVSTRQGSDPISSIVAQTSRSPKDWIHDNVKRDDCYAFLSSQKEGSFVVFKELLPEEHHALAVSWGGTVVQEAIHSVPGEGFTLTVGGAPLQPVFPTLDALLIHYQQAQFKVPFVLLEDNPVFAAEEYASRRISRNISLDSFDIDSPLKRKPSTRTSEAITSFRAVIIAEVPEGEIVPVQAPPAKPPKPPSPPPEKIPAFARLVAEAVELSNSNPNIVCLLFGFFS
jgi:hypothetical protein